jgi:hypothetical protein
MSTLYFNRSAHTIALTGGDGTAIGNWTAYNNVDSASAPWDDGSYNFDYRKTHADDAPDSAYGSYGIFIFKTPPRTGLGVHSGRENVKDGLGRKGPQHATNGCVRTTDDAMKQILATHTNDPLLSFTLAESEAIALLTKVQAAVGMGRARPVSIRKVAGSKKKAVVRRKTSGSKAKKSSSKAVTKAVTKRSETAVKKRLNQTAPRARASKGRKPRDGAPNRKRS